MPPRYPKASPARRPLSEAPRAAAACFAGRLERPADGTPRLRDASGDAALLDLPGDLPPGAILEVDAAWEPRAQALRVTQARLLVAPLAPPPAHLRGVPSLEALAARAAMNRAVRDLFDARGFWEVETPALVPSPGTDVYLQAFASRFAGMGAYRPATLYLHTSPELAMKRLLSAGAEKIYQICKCYRDGEATPKHNPEFSMVEWYRAYADAEPIMEDVEALVRAVLPPTLQVGDARVAVHAPFERLTVQEAFQRYAGGIDLLACSDADSLRAAADAAGLGPLMPGSSWEDLFHELLATWVEPRLGWERPTFLTHYPAPLAVLARRSDHDPRVAERFELYIASLELCNGFSELNDPVEQRSRFEEDLQRRRRLGLPAYPLPTAFLDALDAGMPPSGGVALGLDRLLMLRLGAADLSEVLMRAVEPTP